MSLYDKSVNWFDIWVADWQSMTETIRRNMQADLNAGYDPNGATIIKYRAQIVTRDEFYALKLRDFGMMESDEKINRWCYFDLKARGAIA